MRPLVSVVIPAHNPGPYVEPCIQSLLQQTLARDRFEIVFIDDGSSDGTGERLKRLASEQPHVRVIHIAASGAPGRPRNVGIAAAIGEYIQFLDADDELAPRALSRLLRMAHANDSDVVVGKFASETMNRRQDLFIRNRPATTLEETPQLADASMGPTKLFRASMLREQEITFPEGWRQMEDQLFTMRAYLASRVISVLADEPCFYFNKREDEGHLSSEMVDPESHADHLVQVLDEVDAIADAALRHRFAARFYRLEVLGRFAGEQFLEASPDQRARLFSHMQAIARDRIDPSVRDGLGAIARIRSRLLLDGSLDDLVVLARRTQEFKLEAFLEKATWSNGRLLLAYRAGLDRGADAHPLSVREQAGSVLLDPALAGDLVGPVDVADELGSVRAQLSVVDRDTALEWVLPGAFELELRPAPDRADGVQLPTLAGVVEIDPQRVGPGEQPLGNGAWDVQIRWLGFGFNAKAPLRFEPGTGAAQRMRIAPALLGRPVRWIVPLAGSTGGLRLTIGDSNRMPAQIDERARRIVHGGTTLGIALPIATDRTGRLIQAVIHLTGERGTFELPAWLKGSIGRVLVEAPVLPTRNLIPPGRYEISARIGPPGGPGLPLGAAIVREDGHFLLLGSPRASAFARSRGWVAWAFSSARHAARSRATETFRRLPQWAKELVRTGYGRLRA